MKYFFSVLLALSASFYGKAQKIEQLTRNNVCDKWPTVYGDRIAWVATDKNGHEDIFLLEGDSIRQITFSGMAKFIPQLGPGYLVWIEEVPGDHKRIMLYNGNSIRVIDQPSYAKGNLMAKGNIITWSDWDRHYFYDPSRGIPLVGDGWPSDIKTKILGIGDDKIYCLEFDSLDRRLVAFNGSEKKVIRWDKWGADTNFADLLTGDHSLYYCVEDKATGFRKGYYYTDGLQKSGPAWTGAMPYFNDSTLAWAEYSDTTFGPLWLWDGTSTYKIAEYPYDHVLPGIGPNRPAVFVYFYEYIKGSGRKGWREGLSYFNGKDLVKLVPFGKTLESWGQSGNKLVWSMNDADDLKFSNPTEIYLMTMDSSFTNPASQTNSNLRVYYKPISKKIHFEVLSPEIEKYNWVVFDVLGRTILEGNFNSNIGKKEVDAGPLAEKPGIYLVSVRSSKNEIESTTKIFVNH